MKINRGWVKAGMLLLLAGALGLGSCHGWVDIHGGEAHVHVEGCGHYYWHNAWYGYAHPANCGTCYPNYYGYSYGYGRRYYRRHGGWYTSVGHNVRSYTTATSEEAKKPGHPQSS